MPRHISLKPTQSERWRKSAKADDVPPIFLDVPTTKALCAMAALGPLNVKMIKQLIPAKKSQALRGIKRLEKIGLVYAEDVPEMRGTPRVYGLNRGYAGHRYVRRLGIAMWKHIVYKHARTVPKTPFVFRKDNQRPASDVAVVWERGTMMRRILHLLAELRDGEEIYINAASDLLESRSLINVRFDRFAGFTIISERYTDRRYVRLNTKYPAHKQLRQYLRWLNKAAFPRYAEMTKNYRRAAAAGEHSLSKMVRRTREQCRIARIKGRGLR